MSAPFEAQYYGFCPGCGGEINPGDYITYNDDDDIVHEDCL